MIWVENTVYSPYEKRVRPVVSIFKTRRLVYSSSFSSSNTIAGPQSNVKIQVDRNTTKQTYTDYSVRGEFHTDSSVNLEKTLTVGQEVRIVIVQNGSQLIIYFNPQQISAFI